MYARHMKDAEQNRPPSVSADKFIVRLPDGMRDRIAEAARGNNRTMNAEVVARLQDSFESSFPAHIRDEIAGFAEQRGIGFDDAMELLVFAGSASSSQVLVVHPHPGMSVDDLRRLFDVAREKVSPDARVILHSPSAEM